MLKKDFENFSTICQIFVDVLNKNTVLKRRYFKRLSFLAIRATAEIEAVDLLKEGDVRLPKLYCFCLKIMASMPWLLKLRQKFKWHYQKILT